MPLEKLEGIPANPSRISQQLKNTAYRGSARELTLNTIKGIKLFYARCWIGLKQY